MIRFSVQPKVTTKFQFTLIEFELSGVLVPEDLQNIEAPWGEISLKHGVVLSGRGPIWLYGYLIHLYHPAAWIGIYDPRLGIVIVASHCRGIMPGQVLPMEE